jgi:hypothetical protein
MARSGRYGRPSSIVRRSQLKPRERPEGQCLECFLAGLSLTQSRAFCRVCDPRTKSPRQRES